MEITQEVEKERFKYIFVLTSSAKHVVPQAKK